MNSDRTGSTTYYEEVRKALTKALDAIDVRKSSFDDAKDDDDDDDAIPFPFVEFNEDAFAEYQKRYAASDDGERARYRITKETIERRNSALSCSCLIESSSNSFRASIRLKKSDLLEARLTEQVARFLSTRAEQFEIVRRKAVDGFDVSFLVLKKHKLAFDGEKLIEFVIEFLMGVDRETSEQKLSVSSRGRAVYDEFLQNFT